MGVIDQNDVCSNCGSNQNVGASGVCISCFRDSLRDMEDVHRMWLRSVVAEDEAEDGEGT